MRIRNFFFALIALFALATAPATHAASKEIIQLQTQVQALQDQMTQMRQGHR